ncbi:hypothetical protein LTR37_005740 [Vermiconidia calcicola]|uniref:Uncharacterized protein n=1 Tax=Vermiconidia calcicola TaxID=1690605 RepID=A0ACC3NIY1_9PEZI|nr:hypothetical protein LTR37_005740 [Vermiconidia calcicola]
MSETANPDSGHPHLLDNTDIRVKPPITTNSVRNFHPDTISSDARSTRIVVHARFPALVESFLKHKREHGSWCERKLYGTPETFTWRDETRRLVEKRPLVFMGSMDHTVLRNGWTLGSVNCCVEWDRNGTEDQALNQHLEILEYLSYDEIMLGSLIGVSGPSYFINDGNRFNRGKPGQLGTFEDRGIIVGLVGARFERERRMDSTHILTSSDETSDPYQQHPELSSTFQNFFAGRPRSNSGTDFDVDMYKARIRITTDILLLEANARAKEAGRKAWVYVVGLGLGVWQHHLKQAEWYIDTFRTAIQELELTNVRTAEFAYISNLSQSTIDSITTTGGDKGIRVIFSKRNPAAKLQHGDEEQLLVLSYAWDGNAFPGNEYWMGSLSGSGDPAAACMSTIGDLHNPLMNPGFLGRIQVAD